MSIANTVRKFLAWIGLVQLVVLQDRDGEGCLRILRHDILGRRVAWRYDFRLCILHDGGSVTTCGSVQYVKKWFPWPLTGQEN